MKVSSSLLSATDEAWRLLASYLDRYPSANAQYHRCVINKLLSHDVPLPDWLIKSYKVRQEGHIKNVLTIRKSVCLLQAFILTRYSFGINVEFCLPSHDALLLQAVDAASLLRLFLNFDLLDAAAELVLEYVDALLGKGHQYFGIEVCTVSAHEETDLRYAVRDFMRRITDFRFVVRDDM